MELVNNNNGRTQLLDDLKKRRRYWKQKEEAEDRKRWKQQFIIAHKQVGIFHNPIDLLISSMFNNNNI